MPSRIMLCVLRPTKLVWHNCIGAETQCAKFQAKGLRTQADRGRADSVADAQNALVWGCKVHMQGQARPCACRTVCISYWRVPPHWENRGWTGGPAAGASEAMLPGRLLFYHCPAAAGERTAGQRSQPPGRCAPTRTALPPTILQAQACCIFSISLSAAVSSSSYSRQASSGNSWWAYRLGRSSRCTAR